MGQFLPINRKEMEERGWQEVDFVYICGDAYVDHPSFGAAIICRTLEAHGFTDCCYLASRILAVEGTKHGVGVWQTTFGIFGVCRQYGFNGQSLYCFQEKTPSRRLYIRRR